MNSSLKEQFKSNLSKLIGKECWGIVDSAGSHISIKFGKKILRQKPLDNLHLSEHVRLNKAEFSLFVLCVWRIESKEKIVCGAWSESKENANQLLDQKVTAIGLEEPSFDLSLTFSNDLKLRIFCDQTNETDKNDNYDFFTPTDIFSVLAYSRDIAIETRHLK